MNIFESGLTSAAAVAGRKALSRDIAIDHRPISKDAPEQQAAYEVAIERAREVGAPLEADELSTGERDRPRRVLLIGLDGATPELVLGAWRGDLRTLDMLADRGVWGSIRSSLPATSLPAWLCLLSGQDPGQLGIYGARRRTDHSYAAPLAVNSRALVEPRLWDILGVAGKHVGVVGAPATTPARPVRGHLIGDNLRPGNGPTIFPTSLGRQVSTWLEDAPAPRPAPAGDDIGQLIQDVYARTEQRFLLARRLLARGIYDCFVLVDDGIAAIQRALWDSLDTAHPLYRPNHPFAGTIGSFYRFVDEQISDMLELVDDDTVIVVVSACGAQALNGEFALNEWLLAAGELTLKAVPAGPTPIERCAVDWERTRAWASDDGMIYLNVAGREPRGTIRADQVEQAGASITERLLALPGPDGQPGAVEVYHPSALYAEVHGIAPDLFVRCTRPGWRPTAALGRGGIWVDAHHAPLDTAFESSSGLLILYDPRNLGGGRRLAEATIYDIVPTLLAVLGQPIPARLGGRALVES